MAEPADPPAPHLPRTVLVTGAGGAGRSTVAAATALSAAGRGLRTRLLTTDRDTDRDTGWDIDRNTDRDIDRDTDEPVSGLEVVRIDPGADFRERAAELQHHSQGALDLLGARPLDEDELTELPGSAAFATLSALRAAHGAAAAGELDAIVVDLPPAEEAIRLLGLPEQLRRYLHRLLPAQRQAARALRPVLAQLAGVPMPAERLYDTAERWQRELAAVQETIEAPGTSVHLVIEPGRTAPATVDSARAGLALHGLPLDTVIVNRLLPTGSPDPWLAGLSGQQQTVCKELRDALDPVPLHELPHLGSSPRGTADLANLTNLADLAALGVPAPSTVPAARPAPSVQDRLAADGELVWRLPLPGAVRERLALARRGDEVIVTSGPFRRALPLDGALRRCTVAGARLADGELAVRFAPDPGLWPRPR